MRIEEFHIEGFGRFRDVSVTALDPGLSVVLGKNEAGKSTLLAFLRSVLFGLPSRKQGEFYPPLNGGRHGGRITLVDGQQERIVVERFGGKGRGTFAATFSDGSLMGEEQFRQRLGMVAGDVYEKVFAFGLAELQTFESLQDENIRDAIYSAGIGTGKRSPTQVIKELRDLTEKSFKKGGDKPKINQILKRLLHRQQQIESHATDQDEYQRLQDELKRTEHDKQALHKFLHEFKQRSARVQTLLQARDDWVLLTDARERLQSLPVIESFPPDGVSRLESLLHEQRLLQNQLREVQDELLEAEQECTVLSVDEALLALGSDIRGLERRVDLHQQNCQQLLVIQTDRRLAEEQFQRDLRNLGEEWTADRLRIFDLSIPAREEFDSVRQACDAARRRVEEQAAEIERRQAHWEECLEREQSECERLQQLAGPAANLDVDGIRRLGRHQAAYDAARRDLPRVRQACQDNEDRLQGTLRSINPDWTEGRLDEFDDSLSARESLNVHRDRLQNLRVSAQQLASRLEEAKQTVRDHQATVDRDAAALAALPPVEHADEVVLNERKRQLRELRSLLTQKRQLSSETGHQAERKQDIECQLFQLDQELDELDSSRKWPWAAGGLVLLGLLGLFALGVFRHDWWGGTLIFVMSSIMAGVLWAGMRTSTAAAQNRRQQHRRNREQLVQRLTEVDAKLQSASEQEHELTERLQRQAADAGIVSASGDDHHGLTLGSDEIDRQEGLVDQQLQILETRRPLEQRLDHERSAWKQAQSALEAARLAATEAQEQLVQATQSWKEWLRAAGLPETLSPETAIDVLSRLSTGRELLKAVKDQRRRIQEMQQEIDTYEESVRAVASKSDLHELPSETAAAVQWLSDRLDEHFENLRGIEEARRRVRDAEQQTAQADDRVKEARRIHSAELGVLKTAEQQWVELLRRRGLRETLKGEHAEQMILGITQAREQLGQLEKLQATERTLTEQTATFVREVNLLESRPELPANVSLSTSSTGEAERLVLDSTALQPGETSPVGSRVEALASRLHQAEQDQRRRQLLRETIQKSTDRLRRFEEQIADLQEQIDHLFASAGTNDEDTFRQRADDDRSLRSLKDEIRSLETRLRQLAGNAEALAELEEELTRSLPEALMTEQQELHETLQEHEDRKEEIVRVYAKLQHSLEQLQRSDEISLLRIQQESDRAEFQQQARGWAVLRIAVHLIDRAREKYERERRPAVLKRAERHLARLTHDRYGEILAPVGSQPTLVAQDGSRKELSQLSRGTAEQLYLSLRFGFIEEFIERSEPLPLIFDDILVNFDAGRARAAAEAIVELSRSQQMLFFTCHPATVQMFRDVDQHVHVYELHNGNLAISGNGTPAAEQRLLKLS